ncbi:MAG: hypothetical protein JSV03_06365, partial [Planctomycetota bacterium]
MQRVKGVGIAAAVAAVLVVTTQAVGGTNLMSIGVLNPAPDGTVASGVYATSPEGTYAVGYSDGPDSAGTATIQQPIIWSQATGLVQLPNPVDIDGQARGVVVRPNAGMIGIAGNINNRMYYYQAPPDNLASGSWTENGRSERGLIGPYNTARLGVDYPATEGWFIGGDYSGSLKDYVQGVDGPASLDHKNTGGGECVSHSVSGEKWTAGYDHGNPGGQHRALFMNYNNGDVQVVIPGGSSYLSEALGISAAGTVLSGYDASDATNNQAFVWKVGDAAMTLLDTLPGDTQSNAITVNLIGSDYITAGYSSDGANERAVIWDTTGTWDNTGQPKLVSDLLATLGGDLSVWTNLTRVTTMSDDGM